MASTTNLGLTKIQGADYVKPDTFNDNYDLIDPLGKDYVVDSGESGDWYYRKMKSGQLECWSRINGKVSGTECHFGKAFPFAFASNPVVSAAGGIAGTKSSFVKYVNASTTSIDAYLESSLDSVDGYDCWLMVHVMGTVKA